ncbi:MAG: TIGR03643 family protein [Ferruginibacter sp.]|nr:TIGR03643 family protein [Cytophagales bacterium]
MNPPTPLRADDVDRIVEMAWEDRTPFEAIEAQFGLRVNDVIDLMRRQLLPSGFRRWRKRTSGRATKHQRLRATEVERFKCTRQRTISGNRIPKRA